ncbi:MAG: hypothetical protein ACRDSI_20700 [Pseudonocardiaceae bacterium]
MPDLVDHAARCSGHAGGGVADEVLAGITDIAGSQHVPAGIAVVRLGRIRR